MSQMVLPQNLSSHSPSEASSASATSRTGGEKSGDSSFDTVSRAEQKRLDEKRARDSKDASDAKDAQQADRNRQADNADKADKAEVKAERPDAEQRPDSKAAEADLKEDEPVSTGARQKLAADVADAGTEVAVANPLLESDSDDLPVTAVSAPLTFAGLQSLVAPAQPQTAASGTGTPAATRQGLPFVQGSVMMSVPGMNGGGRTGSMALQSAGQNNSPPGMALTETLLAGVNADGGKASESPMLQNAIRFQGALESVNAQANAVNTPKMAPDAPILRGYTTSIDVPVSHAEWGDKVAGKLTWLTARNMSVAEIHLTPPDMGPMEVKVQVQQEQASITVHSANPVVREQLELHSHRLRDMLGEQGISLEQFDVSDSDRGQAGDGESEGGDRRGDGIVADAESDDAGSQVGALDLTWKGEVDVFA